MEDHIFFTNAPKYKDYSWNPKKDISAYELAICLPVLLSHDYNLSVFIEKLPEEAKRHFDEIDS